VEAVKRRAPGNRAFALLYKPSNVTEIKTGLEGLPLRACIEGVVEEIAQAEGPFEAFFFLFFHSLMSFFESESANFQLSLRDCLPC